MKKTITFLSLALATSWVNAQTNIANFETFTLSTNSFYKDTNSVPFQTTNALFRYSWDKPFSYWSGGFSYTNKQDSTNGNFSNLYNCRAFKGYNNSNFYVTGQNFGIIKIKSPYNKVDGFYITNTTYAYKSMKNGDSFAKKFGGPSGNDPDWFKITAKGYLNGSLKSDSSEFYLADYRFSNNANDYIVQSWQWFNTANLGQVDSIQFFMYSSDVGSFGINTPLFFSIDDFTTSQLFVGISENSYISNLFLYPNPTNGNLNIDFHQNVSNPIGIRIMDITGKEVYTQTTNELKNAIDLSSLTQGVYFVEVIVDGTKVIKRVTKL
ncbi:MAG: DUF4465 domain-containing protein [Bacteroidota bacterium]|nr:DUF4465 domain-containing protein [Bacteroidota bacterium]